MTANTRRHFVKKLATASDMDHEETGKELEKCITVKNDQTDN